MTWEAPARPQWVQAVNRGDIVPMAEVAQLPFERDALLGEARARVGLDDFGDDAFLEPLDILLPALEEEAQLTIVGRWMTRRFLLRLLEVRLQMVAYVRADPGVRDEEIVEPLFVTGAPRTGTTILHAALAQDPTHRVPLGWELLRPVPPPDPAASGTDARLPLADRELRMFAVVTGTLDAIHEYGAGNPKECLSAMSFEMMSEEFTTRYRVPSYTKWLEGCDMRRAYEAHRLVLQILQRRDSGVAWVLKSPVHLHSLDTLLAVYPDAQVAVTHRDPLTVLGSLTSLVATLRWAHSDRVAMEQIAQELADRFHATLDGLVAKPLDPACTYHGHYAAFLSEPVTAVEKLYVHLGRPFTADTAQRIRDHLAARPQGQHGSHAYSFDDLGLDREEQRARFARYQQHFDVPAEA